eukprot:gene12431-15630_t
MAVPTMVLSFKTPAALTSPPSEDAAVGRKDATSTSKPAHSVAEWLPLPPGLLAAYVLLHNITGVHLHKGSGAGGSVLKTLSAESKPSVDPSPSPASGEMRPNEIPADSNIESAPLSSAASGDVRPSQMPADSKAAAGPSSSGASVDMRPSELPAGSTAAAGPSSSALSGDVRSVRMPAGSKAAVGPSSNAVSWDVTPGALPADSMVAAGPSSSAAIGDKRRAEQPANSKAAAGPSSSSASVDMRPAKRPAASRPEIAPATPGRKDMIPTALQEAQSSSERPSASTDHDAMNLIATERWILKDAGQGSVPEGDQLTAGGKDTAASGGPEPGTADAVPAASKTAKGMETWDAVKASVETIAYEAAAPLDDSPSVERKSKASAVAAAVGGSVAASESPTSDSQSAGRRSSVSAVAAAVGAGVAALKSPSSDSQFAGRRSSVSAVAAAVGAGAAAAAEEPRSSMSISQSDSESPVHVTVGSSSIGGASGGRRTSIIAKAVASGAAVASRASQEGSQYGGSLASGPSPPPSMSDQASRTSMSSKIKRSGAAETAMRATAEAASEQASSSSSLPLGPAPASAQSSQEQASHSSSLPLGAAPASAQLDPEGSGRFSSDSTVAMDHQAANLIIQTAEHEVEVMDRLQHELLDRGHGRKGVGSFWKVFGLVGTPMAVLGLLSLFLIHLQGQEKQIGSAPATVPHVPDTVVLDTTGVGSPSKKVHPAVLYPAVVIGGVTLYQVVKLCRWVVRRPRPSRRQTPPTDVVESPYTASVVDSPYAASLSARQVVASTRSRSSGSAVSVLEAASVGDQASLGQRATAGGRASFGQSTSVGNIASFGQSTPVGDQASYGRSTSVGEGTSASQALVPTHPGSTLTGHAQAPKPGAVETIRPHDNFATRAKRSSCTVVKVVVFVMASRTSYLASKESSRSPTRLAARASPALLLLAAASAQLHKPRPPPAAPKPDAQDGVSDTNAKSGPTKAKAVPKVVGLLPYVWKVAGKPLLAVTSIELLFAFLRSRHDRTAVTAPSPSPSPLPSSAHAVGGGPFQAPAIAKGAKPLALGTTVASRIAGIESLAQPPRTIPKPSLPGPAAPKGATDTPVSKASVLKTGASASSGWSKKVLYLPPCLLIAHVADKYVVPVIKAKLSSTKSSETSKSSKSTKSSKRSLKSTKDAWTCTADDDVETVANSRGVADEAHMRLLVRSQELVEKAAQLANDVEVQLSSEGQQTNPGGPAAGGPVVGGPAGTSAEQTGAEAADAPEALLDKESSPTVLSRCWQPLWKPVLIIGAVGVVYVVLARQPKASSKKEQSQQLLSTGKMPSLLSPALHDVDELEKVLKAGQAVVPTPGTVMVKTVGPMDKTATASVASAVVLESRKDAGAPEANTAAQKEAGQPKAGKMVATKTAKPSKPDSKPSSTQSAVFVGTSASAAGDASSQANASKAPGWLGKLVPLPPGLLIAHVADAHLVPLIKAHFSKGPLDAQTGTAPQRPSSSAAPAGNADETQAVIHAQEVADAAELAVQKSRALVRKTSQLAQQLESRMSGAMDQLGAFGQSGSTDQLGALAQRGSIDQCGATDELDGGDVSPQEGSVPDASAVRTRNGNPGTQDVSADGVPSPSSVARLWQTAGKPLMAIGGVGLVFALVMTLKRAPAEKESQPQAFASGKIPSLTTPLLVSSGSSGKAGKKDVSNPPDPTILAVVPAKLAFLHIPPGLLLAPVAYATLLPLVKAPFTSAHAVDEAVALAHAQEVAAEAQLAVTRSQELFERTVKLAQDLEAKLLTRMDEDALGGPSEPSMQMEAESTGTSEASSDDPSFPGWLGRMWPAYGTAVMIIGASWFVHGLLSMPPKALADKTAGVQALSAGVKLPLLISPAQLEGTTLDKAGSDSPGTGKASSPADKKDTKKGGEASALDKDSIDGAASALKTAPDQVSKALSKQAWLVTEMDGAYSGSRFDTFTLSTESADAAEPASKEAISEGVEAAAAAPVANPVAQALAKQAWLLTEMDGVPFGGSFDTSAASKPDVKVAAKTDAQDASIPDAKPDAKVAATPDSKAAGKPDALLDGKGVAQPDRKSGTEPDKDPKSKPSSPQSDVPVGVDSPASGDGGAKAGAPKWFGSLSKILSVPPGLLIAHVADKTLVPAIKVQLSKSSAPAKEPSSAVEETDAVAYTQEVANATQLPVQRSREVVRKTSKLAHELEAQLLGDMDQTNRGGVNPREASVTVDPENAPLGASCVSSLGSSSTPSWLARMWLAYRMPVMISGAACVAAYALVSTQYKTPARSGPQQQALSTSSKLPSLMPPALVEGDKMRKLSEKKPEKASKLPLTSPSGRAVPVGGSQKHGTTDTVPSKRFQRALLPSGILIGWFSKEHVGRFYTWSVQKFSKQSSKKPHATCSVDAASSAVRSEGAAQERSTTQPSAPDLTASEVDAASSTPTPEVTSLAKVVGVLGKAWIVAGKPLLLVASLEAVGHALEAAAEAQFAVQMPQNVVQKTSHLTQAVEADLLTALEQADQGTEQASTSAAAVGHDLEAAAEAQMAVQRSQDVVQKTSHLTQAVEANLVTVLEQADQGTEQASTSAAAVGHDLEAAAEAQMAVQRSQDVVQKTSHLAQAVEANLVTVLEQADQGTEQASTSAAAVGHALEAASEAQMAVQRSQTLEAELLTAMDQGGQGDLSPQQASTSVAVAIPDEVEPVGTRGVPSAVLKMQGWVAHMWPAYGKPVMVIGAAILLTALAPRRSKAPVDQGPQQQALSAGGKLPSVISPVLVDGDKKTMTKNSAKALKPVVKAKLAKARLSKDQSSAATSTSAATTAVAVAATAVPVTTTSAATTDGVEAVTHALEVAAEAQSAVQRSQDVVFKTSKLAQAVEADLLTALEQDDLGPEQASTSAAAPIEPTKTQDASSAKLSLHVVRGWLGRMWPAYGKPVMVLGAAILISTVAAPRQSKVPADKSSHNQLLSADGKLPSLVSPAPVEGSEKGKAADAKAAVPLSKAAATQMAADKASTEVVGLAAASEKATKMFSGLLSGGEPTAVPTTKGSKNAADKASSEAVGLAAAAEKATKIFSGLLSGGEPTAVPTTKGTKNAAEKAATEALKPVIKTQLAKAQLSKDQSSAAQAAAGPTAPAATTATAASAPAATTLAPSAVLKMQGWFAHTWPAYGKPVIVIGAAILLSALAPRGSKAPVDQGPQQQALSAGGKLPSVISPLKPVIKAQLAKAQLSKDQASAAKAATAATAPAAITATAATAPAATTATAATTPATALAATTVTATAASVPAATTATATSTTSPTTDVVSTVVHAREVAAEAQLAVQRSQEVAAKTSQLAQAVEAELLTAMDQGGQGELSPQYASTSAAVAVPDEVEPAGTPGVPSPVLKMQSWFAHMWPAYGKPVMVIGAAILLSALAPRRSKAPVDQGPQQQALIARLLTDTDGVAVSVPFDTSAMPRQQKSAAESSAKKAATQVAVGLADAAKKTTKMFSGLLSGGESASVPSTKAAATQKADTKGSKNADKSTAKETATQVATVGAGPVAIAFSAAEKAAKWIAQKQAALGSSNTKAWLPLRLVLLEAADDEEASVARAQKAADHAQAAIQRSQEVVKKTISLTRRISEPVDAAADGQLQQDLPNRTSHDLVQPNRHSDDLAQPNQDCHDLAQPHRTSINLAKAAFVVTESAALHALEAGAGVVGTLIDGVIPHDHESADPLPLGAGTSARSSVHEGEEGQAKGPAPFMQRLQHMLKLLWACALPLGILGAVAMSHHLVSNFSSRTVCSKVSVTDTTRLSKRKTSGKIASKVAKADASKAGVKANQAATIATAALATPSAASPTSPEVHRTTSLKDGVGLRTSFPFPMGVLIASVLGLQVYDHFWPCWDEVDKEHTETKVALAAEASFSTHEEVDIIAQGPGPALAKAIAGVTQPQADPGQQLDDAPQPSGVAPAGPLSTEGGKEDTQMGSVDGDTSPEAAVAPEHSEEQPVEILEKSALPWSWLVLQTAAVLVLSVSFLRSTKDLYQVVFLPAGSRAADQAERASSTVHEPFQWAVDHVVSELSHLPEQITKRLSPFLSPFESSPLLDGQKPAVAGSSTPSHGASSKMPSASRPTWSTPGQAKPAVVHLSPSQDAEQQTRRFPLPLQPPAGLLLGLVLGPDIIKTGRRAHNQLLVITKRERASTSAGPPRPRQAPPGQGTEKAAKALPQGGLTIQEGLAASAGLFVCAMYLQDRLSGPLNAAAAESTARTASLGMVLGYLAVNAAKTWGSKTSVSAANANSEGTDASAVDAATTDTSKAVSSTATTTGTATAPEVGSQDRNLPKATTAKADKATPGVFNRAVPIVVAALKSAPGIAVMGALAMDVRWTLVSRKQRRRASTSSVGGAGQRGVSQTQALSAPVPFAARTEAPTGAAAMALKGKSSGRIGVKWLAAVPLALTSLAASSISWPPPSPLPKPTHDDASDAPVVPAAVAVEASEEPAPSSVESALTEGVKSKAVSNEVPAISSGESAPTEGVKARAVSADVQGAVSTEVQGEESAKVQGAAAALPTERASSLAGKLALFWDILGKPTVIALGLILAACAVCQAHRRSPMSVDSASPVASETANKSVAVDRVSRRAGPKSSSALARTSKATSTAQASGTKGSGVATASQERVGAGSAARALVDVQTQFAQVLKASEETAELAVQLELAAEAAKLQSSKRKAQAAKKACDEVVRKSHAAETEVVRIEAKLAKALRAADGEAAKQEAEHARAAAGKVKEEKAAAEKAAADKSKHDKADAQKATKASAKERAVKQKVQARQAKETAKQAKADAKESDKRAKAEDKEVAREAVAMLKAAVKAADVAASEAAAEAARLEVEAERATKSAALKAVVSKLAAKKAADRGAARQAADRIAMRASLMAYDADNEASQLRDDATRAANAVAKAGASKDRALKRAANRAASKASAVAQDAEREAARLRESAEKSAKAASNKAMAEEILRVQEQMAAAETAAAEARAARIRAAKELAKLKAAAKKSACGAMKKRDVESFKGEAAKLRVAEGRAVAQRQVASDGKAKAATGAASAQSSGSNWVGSPVVDALFSGAMAPIVEVVKNPSLGLVMGSQELRTVVKEVVKQLQAVVRQAVAERKASERRAGLDRKTAERQAVEEREVAEMKAAADRRAAERQAAREKAADEKLLLSAKGKDRKQRLRVAAEMEQAAKQAAVDLESNVKRAAKEDEAAAKLGAKAREAATKQDARLKESAVRVAAKEAEASAKQTAQEAEVAKQQASKDARMVEKQARKERKTSKAVATPGADASGGSLRYGRGGKQTSANGFRSVGVAKPAALVSVGLIVWALWRLLSQKGWLPKSLLPETKTQEVGDVAAEDETDKTAADEGCAKEAGPPEVAGPSEEAGPSESPKAMATKPTVEQPKLTPAPRDLLEADRYEAPVPEPLAGASESKSTKPAPKVEIIEPETIPALIPAAKRVSNYVPPKENPIAKVALTKSASSGPAKKYPTPSGGGVSKALDASGKAALSAAIASNDLRSKLQAAKESREAKEAKLRASNSLGISTSMERRSTGGGGSSDDPQGSPTESTSAPLVKLNWQGSAVFASTSALPRAQTFEPVEVFEPDSAKARFAAALELAGAASSAPLQSPSAPTPAPLMKVNWQGRPVSASTSALPREETGPDSARAKFAAALELAGAGAASGAPPVSPSGSFPSPSINVNRPRMLVSPQVSLTSLQTSAPTSAVPPEEAPEPDSAKARFAAALKLANQSAGSIAYPPSMLVPSTTSSRSPSMLLPSPTSSRSPSMLVPSPTSGRSFSGKSAAPLALSPVKAPPTPANSSPSAGGGAPAGASSSPPKSLPEGLTKEDLAGFSKAELAAMKLIAMGVDNMGGPSPPHDATSVHKEVDEAPPAADAVCRYKVEVKTSNLLFAGTDAADTKVYVKLVGADGRTQEHSLDQLDVFYFEDADVGGPYQELQVSCAAPSAQDGWHLEYVDITNFKTSEKTRFEHRKWFNFWQGWSQTVYPLSEAGEKDNKDKKDK